MRKVEALNAEKTALTQQSRNGKQHIGYGMVRDFISEFKEAKEKEREKEAEERRKQREKEYESRRSDSDLESRMGEVVGTERGIGGTGIAKMEAGTDTKSAAGHDPPVDIVAGGPQEVQFTDISALCLLFFSAISISICRQTNTTKVILKASALKVS
ncbi:hypothetical protein V6N11_062976 [Hibiscus sabdariffa]|uniref:Uncharacterized protein n=1 Tax=Hibiscus sabdariffa TaxID=183260 RepID=A0ABR2NQ38_9ROSI